MFTKHGSMPVSESLIQMDVQNTSRLAFPHSPKDCRNWLTSLQSTPVQKFVFLRFKLYSVASVDAVNYTGGKHWVSGLLLQFAYRLRHFRLIDIKNRSFPQERITTFHLPLQPSWEDSSSTLSCFLKLLDKLATYLLHWYRPFHSSYVIFIWQHWKYWQSSANCRTSPLPWHNASG